MLEIKKNYSDFSYGDYILVFDNPDDIESNKEVTYKEAMAVFDECLTVIANDPT